MTQTEKCAKINEVLNSRYKCYCGAIGLIYPHIDNPTYKNQLSVWWTNFVSSVADQYSTQFGDCDITFECDITTGSVLSTVTVTTVSFTMTFPTTLTVAEIRSIVAATLGVPESWVTVTTSTRRRLQTTQTATVKIEFTGNDATKAAAIQTQIDSGNTVWVDSSGNTVSGLSSTGASVGTETQVFFVFVFLQWYKHKCVLRKFACVEMVFVLLFFRAQGKNKTKQKKHINTEFWRKCNDYNEYNHHKWYRNNDNKGR